MSTSSQRIQRHIDGLEESIDWIFRDYLRTSIVFRRRRHYPVQLPQPRVPLIQNLGIAVIAANTASHRMPIVGSAVDDARDRCEAMRLVVHLLTDILLIQANTGVQEERLSDEQLDRLGMLRDKGLVIISILEQGLACYDHRRHLQSRHQQRQQQRHGNTTHDPVDENRRP